MGGLSGASMYLLQHRVIKFKSPKLLREKALNKFI
jgi:hypothetical protein